MIFAYHQSRKQGVGGFTVMELIVVLGITAVMAGSVYRIYTNALKIDIESRSISDSLLRSYMIFKSMDDDLGRGIAYRVTLPGDSNPSLVFEGTSKTLAFVKETPEGLRWIRYALDEPEKVVIQGTYIGKRYTKNEDQDLKVSQQAEANQWFIRQETPFEGLSPAEMDKVGKEILSKNIKAQGIKFYYAQPSATSGLTWVETWHEFNLPAAIRVDVRLTPGSSDRVLEFSKVILLPTGF